MDTKKINVLGLGVMGTQISALLRLAGWKVFAWNRNLRDEHRTRHERAVKLMNRVMGLTQAPGEIVFVPEIRALENNLTIENLSESLDVKHEVLGQLAYGFDSTDLFTNSSSYEPREIHPKAQGLHFFNPPHVLKFIEFAAGASPLTPAGTELIASLRSAGFEIIEAFGNRGYIGNYILFHEIASALKLAELHQYKSATIDRVLSHMGRSTSLFDIIDMVGVDVTRSILVNLREHDSTIYVPPLLDLAVSKGILGKKNKTSIRTLTDA